ncbi:MAG TPA: hypothetical protein VLV15_03765, partial [Dongiaceae bacterium]|nr:hypothetical protein [Dongiaceae bacterium]
MIARILLVGLIAMAYIAPWPLVLNTASSIFGDGSIYAFNVDTVQWSHHTLFLMVFLLAAGMLWQADRWLAAIVALAGVQTFVGGPRVTTIYLLLGVGILALGRMLTDTWRARAVLWLGISGAVQAVAMLAQWWKGLPAVGTLGVTGIAACYVVMTGLLLPGWMLPLVGAAAVVSSTRTAVIAFVIGLGVRYVPLMPAAILALVILGTTAAYAMPPSAQSRVDVWRAAFVDTTSSWTRTVLGVGLGRWAEYQAPTKAESGDTTQTPRKFLTAHNDPLQWLYETGLLGGLLLAGWLVRWRRLAISPVAAPLVAVSVMSLAWFPFHDLRTGMLAALL